DAPVVDPFVAALQRRGAIVLTADEALRFAAAAVDPATGSLRESFVGRPASEIAAAARIVRAEAPRLIVVHARASDLAGFAAREKLAPVLSLFTVDGEDDGIRLSRALLEAFGAGHTAIIHTANAARVERFARAVPAGRILVNSPGAHGCCGMTTGLD